MSKISHKFKAGELIVIDVLLETERKITVRMAIDTGATYTLVPWKIIQALGIDTEKEKEYISIVTASTTEQAPMVQIPFLSVLGKRVKNLKVVAHDLPPASRVDGLSGLNALLVLKMKIDFSRNLISLRD